MFINVSDVVRIVRLIELRKSGNWELGLVYMRDTFPFKSCFAPPKNMVELSIEELLLI